jgi:hypothetical protein
MTCSLTGTYLHPEHDYCCEYHCPYSEEWDDYSESEMESSGMDPDEYSDARSHSSPGPRDGGESDPGTQSDSSEAGQDVFHDAKDVLTS